MQLGGSQQGRTLERWSAYNVTSEAIGTGTAVTTNMPS
jgi:hypothetical protein